MILCCHTSQPLRVIEGMLRLNAQLCTLKTACKEIKYRHTFLCIQLVFMR